MSNGHGIDDEQLPEDLRPGEDNPLAKGLDNAETAGGLKPGELLEEGKSADQDSENGEDDEKDDEKGDERDDERDDAED
jgi:hypothetical protein